MALTKADKVELAGKAVTALGLICVVIAVVGLYCLAFYQGVSAGRKQALKEVQIQLKSR